MFFYGLPLAGYNNSQDRYTEQIAKIEEYLKGTVLPIIRTASTNAVDLKVLVNAPVNLELHFNDIIFADSILVTAAVGMVFLYIWFHTQSFFIANFGILHVVLSFPCAYLCMMIIMDVAGMSVLNFMALFIILGIGAE